MKERPHESIGVATMNQKQKELIENKFILESLKARTHLNTKPIGQKKMLA